MATAAPIIAVAVAVASVVCFAAVLILTAFQRVLAMIPGTAVAGVTTMLDADLDDDAKERAVRQAGIRLLALAWQITWRIALAIGAAAIPILAADTLGLVASEAGIAIMVRLDFIVVVSIVAIVFVRAISLRVRAESPQAARITDSSAYGAGDRLIHAVAFASPRLQRRLARLDDSLFARQIADVADNPPIFITSLARGGTTALLNAMHDLPLIGTHRYCDMPFISAPMLWSRLAGRRSRVAERERAHGDGLKIGLQSPEAFDEILWMLCWPEKYRDKKILLWQKGDLKTPAQAFFRTHFRKIAKLRHPSEAAAVRYLSKNNANVARLDLLPTLFPGCQLVIVLREPSAHAASLHRQHQNFSRLHASDAFSMRYMRDIGHFEFGALHRPIAFDPELIAPFDPSQPDYWLAYWIAAFEQVRQHLAKVLVVSQERLRLAPQETMRALLERLNMVAPPARNFRSDFLGEPDVPLAELFSPDLLHRARQTYDDLGAFAVH
jgi:hypothetical protein